MIQGAIDADRIDRELEGIAGELRRRLRDDGVADEDIQVTTALDCRYLGQGYELRVPLRGAGSARRPRGVPPHAPPGVRARVHRPDRGRQPARHRDRGAPEGRAPAARGRRDGRCPDRRGRGVFRVDSELASLPTRHYERSRLPAGEPSRAPRSSSSATPRCWSPRAGAVVPSPPATSYSPDEHRPHPRRPVLASVIAGALDSIATEMGHKLARMSYSSIIRESEDFGCVICDADARQLCESRESTPAVGPHPRLHPRDQPPLRRDRRGVAARRRRDPQPQLLRRLPRAGRGLRDPDLPRRRPDRVLDDHHAHHLDLGALTPGSCGIVDASDAYAEGLQLTAIKIEEGGRRNEWIWRILRDNVRAASLVVGDMEPRSPPPAPGPSASWSWSTATASTRCRPPPRTSWTTPSGC